MLTFTKSGGLERRIRRILLGNLCRKSPVSSEGGRIRFALPQPFEKALSITVEFDGSPLKATGKDLFVDYWERVP